MPSNTASEDAASSLSQLRARAANDGVVTLSLLGNSRRFVLKICQKCGAKFKAQVWFRGSHSKYCPACTRREEEERERQSQERQAAVKREQRQKVFHAAVPPLYRVSDPARLPAVGLAAVDEYRLTDHQTGEGLGLIGPAGAGKTRCMARLIRRLCMEDGVRVIAVSATEFSHRVSALSSDNLVGLERYLKDLARAPVLFVDDVGKGRMTDRVEAEFFHLLEERSAHALPLLFTSNANATGLLRKFSIDRGEPIVRRLAEFCRVVILHKESEVNR